MTRKRLTLIGIGLVIAVAVYFIVTYIVNNFNYWNVNNLSESKRKVSMTEFYTIDECIQTYFGNVVDNNIDNLKVIYKDKSDSQIKKINKQFNAVNDESLVLKRVYDVDVKEKYGVYRCDLTYNSETTDKSVRILIKLDTVKHVYQILDVKIGESGKYVQ